MKGYALLLTCEHAGSFVPEQYHYLFQHHSEILNSHRGVDIGALQIGTFLKEKLNCPFHYCDTTRLLIEANRSLENKELFSEFTKLLSTKKKKELIDTIYLPYRNAVEQEIEKSIKPVLPL